MFITDFEKKYRRPEFHGNIAWQYVNDSSVRFADQTVLQGMYIAVQSLLGNWDAVSDALDFLWRDLEVMPGYFKRDSMCVNYLFLDGERYTIDSDCLNGNDNQMSVDQIVHLLRGFWWAHKLCPVKIDRVIRFADNIGIRLKKHGFQIFDRYGNLVERGPDARAFAWPIAKVCSDITGTRINEYFDGQMGLSANWWRSAFLMTHSAINLFTRPWNNATVVMTRTLYSMAVDINRASIIASLNDKYIQDPYDGQLGIVNGLDHLLYDTVTTASLADLLAA